MKDLSVRERTLPRVLEYQAAALGDRVFLDYKGTETVSFAQLNDRANRYANGFREYGIVKGVKVAVMLPNCPEYLYVWFGLAKLGAVMAPVNTAQKGRLLQYIIEESDAEAVVVESVWLPRLAEIADGLKKVKSIFVRGEWDARVRGVTLKALDDLELYSAESPNAEIRHSDPMTILFTSGTTGPSKGAVISHHYYYHAARTIGAGMGDGPDDVLYTCLPLFHVNAQVCTVLSAMMFDARVALYEHFSASTFWDEVRRSNATVFLALGAMGNILAKARPNESDRDHNVRLAMVVPPPEDLEAFEQRFGLRVVYETFGMTEGIVTPPQIAEPRRPGCCGRPTPAMEVRIVDQYDNVVNVRQVGEITIRPREPYTMMSGYYRMPEATLEAFRNLWFHTGDLGWVDEDGYLYFYGRKKESIRRRGENISAFEVERVVNEHPSVLESAAVPEPSELGEDDVRIVVVLKEGERLKPEELIEFCESRMAYYMVPRYVDFRSELPKTPTQRVEKYKLQAEGRTAETWDRESAGYRLERNRV
ncbi:MAG: AMP-binding protein [Blastocatellales bacterium]|nr:AMP-binding protein [Blastocatellales bacterium]